MTVTRYNRKQQFDRVKKIVIRKMTAAAFTVESKAVNMISREQPVKRLSSGRLIGLRPSRPGQPPKVLTGRLRQSVTSQIMVTQLFVIGRIGTNVFYGKIHEMHARRWLRPSLRTSIREIKKIFKAK